MVRKVLGFLSCAVIVGFGIGPHPALGAIVIQTYSDVTSWSNAVAVGADATFTDPHAAFGSYDPFNTAAGYTEDGANFVGYNGAGYALQIDNPSASQSWLNWGGGELLAERVFERLDESGYPRHAPGGHDRFRGESDDDRICGAVV